MLLAISLCAVSTVAAQGGLDLSPVPTVTAEAEDWYLSGVPIALGGAVYYPSGPVTHFARNEMIPAGMFERVQIYRRTTQEPGSMIYVPLPGGLVRPYERRRSGDLAGTVGSTAPAFRVVLPAEEALTTTSGAPAFAGPAVPRAVGTSGYVYGALDRARGSATVTAAAPAVAPAETVVPVPVGTRGNGQSTATRLMAPGRPLPTRFETVQRPTGLNAAFVEFRDTKWFTAGAALEFAADRFTQIGEHRGFAVYQEAGRPDVIFLSPVAGTPALVIPYKAR
jgi:hypothetical protein